MIVTDKMTVFFQLLCKTFIVTLQKLLLENIDIIVIVSRDLDLTLVMVLRYIFLDHFWSLFKSTKRFVDDWIIIKKYLNPITETKYQVKITQIKLKYINVGHILKKKCPRGPQ